MCSFVSLGFPCSFFLFLRPQKKEEGYSTGPIFGGIPVLLSMEMCITALCCSPGLCSRRRSSSEAPSHRPAPRNRHGDLKDTSKNQQLSLFIYIYIYIYLYLWKKNLRQPPPYNFPFSLPRVKARSWVLRKCRAARLTGTRNCLPWFASWQPTRLLDTPEGVTRISRTSPKSPQSSSKKASQFKRKKGEKQSS